MSTLARGYIHSVESMGLVDGPGIRYVVFLQGCHLRCAFCHNPDTWNLRGGQVVESAELFERIIRFKPYFQRSGGGVTFSGGEPLLQVDFLLEMLKLCREHGIHTAVDTAGVGYGEYQQLFQYTDLLLLDVKHVEEHGYREITGLPMTGFRDFVKQLKGNRVDVWLRAVIVPGVHDNIDYIRELWTFAKTIPRVKRIELLPYHTLGVNKYEALGIPYPLEGVPPMDKRRVERWQNTLNKALIAQM